MRRWAVCVCAVLVPVLGRQRQEYLHEFKASLLYRLRFRSARALSEALSQEQFKHKLPTPSKMHLNENNVAPARILNLLYLINFLLFKSSSIDSHDSICRLICYFGASCRASARGWLFLRSRYRGDRLAEGDGLVSWHRAFQRKQ